MQQSKKHYRIFEVKQVGDGFDITNESIKDLNTDIGGDATVDYGGDLATDNGVDLNTGVTSEINTDASNPWNSINGENLNDISESQLDLILDNFKEVNWDDLSLAEQKQSMTDLADYVTVDTGNENPPDIVFRDDMPDGTYGGYSPDSNIIEINTNMLDDSIEAADTITHEMWHAYQEQIAKDPSHPRALEYQEAFDNYISPEYDFEGYENQMVETEARDYAQGFKDRLTALKGVA